jgi:hypothetical protein
MEYDNKINYEGVKPLKSEYGLMGDQSSLYKFNPDRVPELDYTQTFK